MIPHRPRPDAVGGPPDPDSQFARLLAEARFPRWLMVTLLAFAVLFAAAITAGFVVLVVSQQNYRDDQATEQRQRDADQAARRVAFCASLDGFGEIALASGEGLLKTFLDPSLQDPTQPPPDQAVIDAFVALYRANTKEAVGQAVDATKEANKCP